MEFSTEILIKARRLGLRIRELDTRYFKRVGRSKLNPIRDGLRISAFMLKEFAVG
jgi:hypothetical protein